MTWIFYAILAPALYGVTNFIDKYLIEKRIRDPILLSIFGGLITLITGTVILLLNGLYGFTWTQLLILFVAGAVGEFALVPYYRALALDDASRIIPIFQVIPVFILVLSYLLLNEKLTIPQISGFFIILFGGFILSIEKFSREIFQIRKSFWYVIFSSFLFALPLVFYKFVVIENKEIWSTLGYEFLGGGVGAIILYFTFRNRFNAEIINIKSNVWGTIISNEGVYVVSRLCTYYAAALVPVSLVSVLGGFQPVFVLLYGFILSIWLPTIITEDIKKSTILVKIIAIILIFAGVYIMGLLPNSQILFPELVEG